jgi:5'-methylthioadenosine phosphorylase
MPVADILGSAFHDAGLLGEPMHVDTPFGSTRVHRVGGDRLVLYRHGLPHRLLPHQLNWRASAYALHALGVRALIVTSSVGVLDPDVPLFEPLLVRDVMMLDNRLPDGTTCSMFQEGGGPHLVLDEGLVSPGLNHQITEIAEELGTPIGAEVDFGYVAGPRTKTRAENRMWARLGAQVNSMTLAPELVLANELGIPCAGLVVGHKLSHPDHASPDHGGVTESLVRSRAVMGELVRQILERVEPPPFGNTLYRFT